MSVTEPIERHRKGFTPVSNCHDAQPAAYGVILCMQGKACHASECAACDTRRSIDDAKPAVEWIARATVPIPPSGRVHQQTGEPIEMVTPEVARERREVCRTCPNSSEGGKRCGLCQCHTPKLTRRADAVCPDSPPRWSAVTSEPTPSPTAVRRRSEER